MDDGAVVSTIDIKPTRSENGRWLKGIAPNPSGRPKENSAAREFKELLSKDAKYLYNKCRQMLEDPEEKGKTKLLTYLIDRLCGRVAQIVDVTTNDSPLPSQMTGLEKTKMFMAWCEDKITSSESSNTEIIAVPLDPKDIKETTKEGKNE